ncbi:MAG TPA: thiamine pyrophosphate-dependent dehydrogenase E1 component subunit alpha [Xanthobacteraceae bacterium]|nr:thiamine pyrophosphate-dependent dehydrogenase E1 component subunit alpha [Xanthobacteraceae bacterium]
MSAHDGSMRLAVTDRASSRADHYRLASGIRAFERMLLDQFATGRIGGTTHTCIGQEVTAVAVTAALERERDCVFSNHRGHGHFLAYCGEIFGLLAEIFGRSDGVCGGRGGSQHLHRRNFYSNGVQGGSVGNAVGVALAEKRKRSGAVTCAWLGDGTFGEGVVYEAMNIASLWRLPIVFTIEANGIAQTTPTGMQLAGSIAARCRAFDIPVEEVSGRDLAEALAAAAHAIDATRSETRPHAIISHAARLGPHSKGDDTRDAAQLEVAWAHDPLVMLRGQIGRAADAIDRDIAVLMQDALARASEATA